LREKAKVLVAFGSCAHEGCIPGLANLFDRQSILERVYLETPSTDNPQGILPQTTYQMPEGKVHIPKLYNTVKTLDQVTEVDYYVLGCPPQAPQIWAVVEAILGGNLPPKGSVVGATEKTVCDECKHIREEKHIKRFYRPHEIIPDPERCLLDQGIICQQLCAYLDLDQKSGRGVHQEGASRH
jgi:F420-non-reducing hydrogenase small subunit